MNLQPSVVIQRFAERFGYPEWLYRGTGFEPGCVLPAFISVADALRMMTNAVRHGELGDVLPYSVHAWRTSTLYALIMGFEVAPTLGNALQLLVEFGGYRNGHYHFVVQRHGPETTLIFQPRLDLGDASILASEPCAVGFYQLISQMRLGDDGGLTASLSHRNHGYSSLFWADPRRVRYDQAMDGLHFPSAWEGETNPRFDPDLWVVARQRCAAAATAMQHGELAFRVSGAIDQLIAETGKVPNLSEVARLQGVSGRTLIRQLKLMGTAYKELVDEVQKARAMELLNIPGARVYDVAEQLGFADSSSFGRTFRRWHGTSPSRLATTGGPEPAAVRKDGAADARQAVT